MARRHDSINFNRLRQVAAPLAMPRALQIGPTFVGDAV